MFAHMDDPVFTAPFTCQIASDDEFFKIHLDKPDKLWQLLEKKGDFRQLKSLLFVWTILSLTSDAYFATQELPLNLLIHLKNLKIR